MAGGCSSPPWQGRGAVLSRGDTGGAGHCHSGECRSITLHYRAVCCQQGMAEGLAPVPGPVCGQMLKRGFCGVPVSEGFCCGGSEELMVAGS